MTKNHKELKALLLFSGGLDSILAAKILEGQGIRVTALTYISYFFDAGQAKISAQKNKLKLIVEDISEKHFKIVKNPRYGRGAGMNPCIDCHLMMLKMAKKKAIAGRYDLIATGEVLGQRPMSQNLRALNLIEKKAGLSGKVLRPLSAKVLPETGIEKSGLIDREKLLGISGRSRKEQLALEKKYNVKYFPTPAGGCILTDIEYSKKLEELLKKSKKIKKSDIGLLRFGRHFWFDDSKIILGRNYKENLALKKLAEKGDVIIEPKNVPGPTALVRGKKNEIIHDFVKKLFLKYTKGVDEKFQLKISEKK